MCPKVRFGHRTATGGPGKVAVRKPPETKIPAPSGTQIVFFTIFGVVTTLLSVGRFCKAICNSVLEQAHFFPIFVLQSAAAGCLGSTEKSGKCCKKYTLYAVYQHNIVLYVLPREQNRNKINNLSDSPLFTFHLVSSLALGRIQSASSSSFPTTDLSVRWLIHELLQPKEKRTGLFLCFISSLKLVSPLR